MRSLSQIYSEAVSKRNDYLQLTELNSGRTEQKMSILNLMTYVMSSLIFTYETILDRHEYDISMLVANRINGSAEWYAMMAKKFQFDQAKETGDPIVFDEDTMKVKYQSVNEANRIITQATWQEYKPDNGIILKVCKDNTNTSEVEQGTLYQPLSDKEMTAFMAYLSKIKFIGANVHPVSLPGDMLTIKCRIYYDDNMTTAEEAFEGVKAKLIEYAKGLDYNGYVYGQGVVSAILSADNITNVSTDIEILIASYDKATGAYSEPVKVTDRLRTASGYVKFVDNNGQSTINMENMVMCKNSESE